MKKIRTWHGVDASTEISLFEYGFIIRWNPKRQQYDVIYGYTKTDGEFVFFYDHWDADDWRKMIKNGEYDLEGIADMCGFSEEDYLDDVRDATLLSDILMYYGASELGFGDYCTPHTESEVRKRLNKALS